MKADKYDEKKLCGMFCKRSNVAPKIDSAEVKTAWLVENVNSEGIKESERWRINKKENDRVVLKIHEWRSKYGAEMYIRWDYSWKIEDMMRCRYSEII